MKEKLFLLALSGMSVFLGTLYSIHNTDSHHWGFIVATAIDFIQGKRLFSEIYVQYGVGQFLLFKLLSSAMPINYTTVGIITSFVYALYFPTLFVCIKHLSSSTLAVLITTVAFLIHPFAIYPWPDYFAGACLSIFCCLLVLGKENSSPFRYGISGAMLFLVYIFRNTYLLGIASSIVLYFALSLLYPRVRHKNIDMVIYAFSGLFICYMVFILYQGNAALWYAQDFGAATGRYGIGIGAISKLLHRLIFVDNLLSAIFLGLLLVSAYTIVFLLAADRNGEILERDPAFGIIIFLALLGCSGVFQVLQFFEIFRLQNTAAPLYLVFAYFLKTRTSIGIRSTNQLNFTFAFGILIAALAAQFPFVLVGSRHTNSYPTSTIWPITALPLESSFRTFSASNIPLFKFHRFQAAELAYYEHLKTYICDGTRKIVNLTRDSTIPYICPGQDNALSLPFFDAELLQIISKGEANRVQAGDFKVNEVLVADSPPPARKSVDLKLITTFNRPDSIRSVGQGTVSVFHVEVIRSD